VSNEVFEENNLVKINIRKCNLDPSCLFVLFPMASILNTKNVLFTEDNPFTDISLKKLSVNS